MMEGFKLRDRALARKVLDTLRDLGQEIRVMHVCGTHQDTLVRFGLEHMLQEAGVQIRQGPGCPVCVTTGGEIELAVKLASSGKVVTSFGDMVKVPGKDSTLADIRAAGGDVRIVYSPDDALSIARGNPDREVVFLGIGFETTAPTTSSLLLEDRAPDNLSILSFHRTVPPALKFIAESGEVRLSGLIEPGHVSMVIGEEPYRFLSVDHKLPQVIAGFEPLDLLMACLEIARQKADGRAELKNMYGRVVRPEGNLAAIRAMAETFEPCDVRWRGFPVIPGSGLEIARKFEDHNARKKFEDELADLQELEVPEPEGCRCGKVLRGLIDPDECPLFGRSCRPDHPTGPCMVSREGGCNILYRWGRNLV